ncbi:hypothetical protein [Kordiimonas gwangyangensis]|uniref:hypothetical protein n=1 Tax=Kordiimonas gwangyangensis TaxID=288022 RepID=UPI00058DD4D3|nr:hypothetical protein [Kordiimonas gwangyangensis]
MSIINGKRHDLRNYEYKNVPADVRADFINTVATVVPWFSDNMSLALIGLECFCQLYDRTLKKSAKHSASNRQIVEQYCVLVFQGKMFDRSEYGNVLMARYFLQCANALNYVDTSPLRLSLKYPDEYREAVAQDLHDLPFDLELLEYWKGWPSVSKSGSRRYFPLQEVLSTCGKDFTKKLYATLDEFFRTRQRGLHGTWQALIDGYAEWGAEGKLEDLKSPQHAAAFLRTLLVRFLSESKNAENPKQYASAAIEWRCQFRTFIQDYLIPAGLLARPEGEFPMPRGERIRGADTNVRVSTSGEKIKAKLITEVPLEVTDRNAVEILFDGIEKDVGWIRSWAEFVTGTVWDNVVRRKRLAETGVAIPLPRHMSSHTVERSMPNTWRRSSSNPHVANDMAATFEEHGYLTGDDLGLQQLYENRVSAARELGMPSTRVILAYCALLTIEHPALTRSALLSLKLYDKNGYMTGYQERDGQAFLISYKPRAGSSNAQKSTQLNERTSALVQQAIQVTQPLRDYLRKKGDDNWRYLFLGSGNTFAPPKPIKNDEISYRHELRREFSADMKELGAPNSVTERLAHAFTLTRLRASAATLEYLRTTSISAMASALGHKEFKTALIDHYLPEPIRRFFEERWVRIFQLGIVCEVMKDSDYLMEASGFQSVAEMDAFLRNHAITFPDEEITVDETIGQVGNVVVGINEDVLGIYCALSQVSEADAEAAGRTFHFWHQFADKLISHIESAEFLRPDIQKMLASVRDKKGPSLIRGFLS